MTTIIGGSSGVTFPDSTTQITAFQGAANSTVLLNSTNATANGTIGAGFNGYSIGPIAYANNVSITVAAGQRWIIV